MTSTIRRWIVPGLLFAMCRFCHKCYVTERSHDKIGLVTESNGRVCDELRGRKRSSWWLAGEQYPCGWHGASLPNSSERINIGFDSTERQLEPVRRHEAYGGWNDVVSRWAFQCEGEDEFHTLSFTSGVKFREIHSNPDLSLEDAICVGEVELVKLSIFANPTCCVDGARGPCPGGKKPSCW